MVAWVYMYVTWSINRTHAIARVLAFVGKSHLSAIGCFLARIFWLCGHSSRLAASSGGLRVRSVVFIAISSVCVRVRAAVRASAARASPRWPLPFIDGLTATEMAICRLPRCAICAHHPESGIGRSLKPPMLFIGLLLRCGVGALVAAHGPTRRETERHGIEHGSRSEKRRFGSVPRGTHYAGTRLPCPVHPLIIGASRTDRNARVMTVQ